MKVHAGEAGGPQGGGPALRQLGAERIGHATRAVEDPALLDYLREHRIRIDSSLTSNVQTSTVPSYAAHPLCAFLAGGLLATINTDHPPPTTLPLPPTLSPAPP